MFSRIFYVAIGFAIGYFLDSLRRGKQTADNQRDFHDNSTLDSEQPFAGAESIALNDERPEEEHGSPDFLQAINGIGPTYAKRLFDGGIRSMALLASAEPLNIAEIAKTGNLSQVSGWIKEAQKSV